MAITHAARLARGNWRLMGVVAVPLYLAMAANQLYLALGAHGTWRVAGVAVAAAAVVLMFVYPTSVRTDRHGGVEVRYVARRRTFAARDVMSARWATRALNVELRGARKVWIPFVTTRSREAFVAWLAEHPASVATGS